MSVLGSSLGVILSGAWITFVATAAIIFRRRIVDFLLRFAVPQEDEVAQRRDMTIGVVLSAVFAYILAATVTATSLLPDRDQPCALAIGLPVAAFISILYWLRFANAGLSVTKWLRR